MKKSTFEKYQMTPEKEDYLFKEAIVFLDTSALLNFYYYSKENTTEIFEKIFRKLENRILISNQTEYEFLKNRRKVITKPINAYHNLIASNPNTKDGGHLDKINGSISVSKSSISVDLKNQLKTLIEKTSKSDKHPFVKQDVIEVFNAAVTKIETELDEFSKSFGEFKESFSTEVEKQIASYKTEIEKDFVLENLEKFLSVTDSFSQAEILNIMKEGEIRFRNKYPPGYMDKDSKIGIQKYGDLIMWLQIISEAKKQRKDVILIINDNKEDWWHQQDDTESPRHELINEFFDVSGKVFWMYSMNDFIFKANKYIATDVGENVIDEVKLNEKIWPLERQEVTVDWAFPYFHFGRIVFNYDYSSDLSQFTNKFDFVGFNDNETICFFEYKHISKSNYNSLYGPLKKVYTELLPELKDYPKFDRIVLVLESDTVDNAENLSKHITRKNPKKILEESDGHIQLIIAFSNGIEIETLYDSNKYL